MTIEQVKEGLISKYYKTVKRYAKYFVKTL